MPEQRKVESFIALAWRNGLGAGHAAFGLEAKKARAGAHTKGFADAQMLARAQADGYARSLAGGLIGLR